MNYFEHNDYEILYQINEGNQEALYLMFEKYNNLIAKKIFQFNLQYEFDDMMQEGKMVLLKSIKQFEDKHQKSFTKYFEMNLTRTFISIVTKRRRRNEIFYSNELFIYEHNHDTVQRSVYYEIYMNEIKKVLTDFEYLVYTLRELKNYSIGYISDKSGTTKKQIYNALHNSKAKIKSHFNN